MNYWWVSQNQTYRHETGNGFMWAPQSTTRAGWYNMTKVCPGDIIFSFSNRRIQAIGIATSKAYDFDKPDFGRVGAVWDTLGWKVDVEYQVPTAIVEPRKHMDILGPLLPEKHSPLQKSGDGNQVYLSAISDEMGQQLLFLTNTHDLQSNFYLDQSEYDELKQDAVVIESLLKTEKESLVLSRRGQGTFRRRVQLFESSCRVTGVTAENLLVASHIKPWAASDDLERLDGNNGLFLAPHIDRLFDKGFISFTKSGKLEISPQLDHDVLDKWQIDPMRNYGKFNTDQAFYLNHHQSKVFLAESAA
jgi:putative restriction endonuclease